MGFFFNFCNEAIATVHWRKRLTNITNNYSIYFFHVGFILYLYMCVIMVPKDLTILIIFLQCTETKDDEKKPADVGWPRYWWSAWVRPFWSAACGRHTAAWLTCTSLRGRTRSATGDQLARCLKPVRLQVGFLIWMMGDWCVGWGGCRMGGLPAT